MSQSATSPIPHVAGYDTSVTELVELSRTAPLASSDRGYEVLGYEEVQSVLNDPRFSKVKGFWKRLDDIGITTGTESRDDWELMIAASEGDLRTSLRVMYATMMRPSRIAKFGDTVRSIIDGVFDDLGDASSIDLMSDIAWKVPSRIYCEMVSVPYDFAPRAARLSDSMQTPMITRDRSRRQEAIDALYEAFDVVTTHIESRRDDLSDDFTSVLIRQETEGKLSLREMHVNAVGLLIVTIDNTAHQMGLVLGTLLERRDVWEALREDHSLIPAAVEEAIRLRPRLNNILRHAEEDAEVAGHIIPAGSTVLASVATANRDAAVLDDPDTFRLDRPPFRQVLFGGGNYNCLGQHLARLEIQETVRTLLTRYPNAHLVNDLDVSEYSYGNEIKSMPVSLR
jgi:cytochrome P450